MLFFPFADRSLATWLLIQFFPQPPIQLLCEICKELLDRGNEVQSMSPQNMQPKIGILIKLKELEKQQVQEGHSDLPEFLLTGDKTPM